MIKIVFIGNKICKIIGNKGIGKSTANYMTLIKICRAMDINQLKYLDRFTEIQYHIRTKICINCCLTGGKKCTTRKVNF